MARMADGAAPRARVNSRSRPIAGEVTGPGEEPLHPSEDPVEA